MNETRRKPTTGRQSPTLFDKWHGIFYMPSRIDGAGHTKAFDDPVAEHWGESQRAKRSLVGLEPTSAHTYESEIQRGWELDTTGPALTWSARPGDRPRLTCTNNVCLVTQYIMNVKSNSLKSDVVRLLYRILWWGGGHSNGCVSLYTPNGVFGNGG